MKNYIPVSTRIIDATKVCCEKSNISGNGAYMFTNISQTYYISVTRACFDKLYTSINKHIR